jgi:hypothetical protein
MSTNERLLGASFSPNQNPALEFMDGQFRLRMVNLQGAIIERFISSAAVIEAFSFIPVDSGWLRPEIVRWGNGKLGQWCVAFIPPGAHELELTQEPGSNTAWKETENVIRISAPLPGLVFFGLSNQYYIWAVKTETLKPHHEIYRCPLPNVEETGKICWGPYNPPHCTPKTIFDAFDLFIRSTFNNHRADGKSKMHRDDVRITLRTAAAMMPVAYPVDDLMRQVPHVGLALDTAIREFFETGTVRTNE